MIALYSNYQAPAEGLGPFSSIFEKGKDAIYLDGSLKVVKTSKALILWGGEDISPSLYDEKGFPEYPSERDLYELELIKLAERSDIPIIGVCRGAQILCAYLGGKLIQDVGGHGRPHKITTFDNCSFETSSAHHQMMYPYDIEHKLLAWSSEHLGKKYVLNDTEFALDLEKRSVKEPEIVYFPQINGFAIQGHPEWMQKNSPFNEWIMKQIKYFCFKER